MCKSEIILSIPIPINSVAEDCPSWPSKDGMCSTKDAYAHLCDTIYNKVRTPDQIRFWIWKSFLTPNLQIFLWKLSYERFLTKSNVFWITEKHCSMCLSCEETLDHLFRSCRQINLEET